MVEKFYLTKIVVTVLTRNDRPPIFGDLSDIAREITDGESSGSIDVDTPIEITAKAAALEAVRQQSDPAFFGIDENGDDIDI